MSGQERTPSTQVAASITVIGKLPKLSSSNIGRIAAFLVQGNNVLAQSPVTANGFRFRLPGSIVIDPCLIVVLGPKGLDDQTLLARTDLPRLSLSAASSREAHSSGVLTLDFSTLNLDDKIVDLWWNWCRTYTVSGTVQTQNGCPVPGAEVTVYNVTSGATGLTETSIETVETNAEGQFTASFQLVRMSLLLALLAHLVALLAVVVGAGYPGGDRKCRAPVTIAPGAGHRFDRSQCRAIEAASRSRSYDGPGLRSRQCSSQAGRGTHGTHRQQIREPANSRPLSVVVVVL